MPLRTKILEILEKDARTTVTDIAVMIGEEEEKVRYEIQSMEEDGTILGYKTIINPERTMEDKVGCLIEVSIQPERGFGFDKVAERDLPLSGSAIRLSRVRRLRSACRH